MSVNGTFRYGRAPDGVGVLNRTFSRHAPMSNGHYAPELQRPELCSRPSAARGLRRPAAGGFPARATGESRSRAGGRS
jgi:hypothetical protein